MREVMGACARNAAALALDLLGLLRDGRLQPTDTRLQPKCSMAIGESLRAACSTD